LHPAPSIIFFTAASGAGYGLLFLLGLSAAMDLVPPDRWLGFAAMASSLGLITLGLLASTFHLGHPERAWRAVTQVNSSWLSREGAAALLTYVPALVFAFGWLFLARTGDGFALAGLLAALGALATVYCTGMIYASLRPIREWHLPIVPWAYLAFALMTGSLLGHALFALFGEERLWISVLALLSSALAPALKVLYWRSIDDRSQYLTPGQATGLGPGAVRLLDPPHTQTNYLLHEMAFHIGRRHALKLRRLALVLGLGGGLLLTALALVTSGLIAMVLTIAAAVSGMAAVAIERWLFFAEATHTVTLYYGGAAA
jgi:sulfite dehydrogenase (quinone) subunit SoeC